jgi:predicted Holliday junction resolvase-like endonuclease
LFAILLVFKLYNDNKLTEQKKQESEIRIGQLNTKFEVLKEEYRSFAEENKRIILAKEAELIQERERLNREHFLMVEGIKSKYLADYEKFEADTRAKFQNWAIEELSRYKKNEIFRVKKELEEIALNSAKVKLEEWKKQVEVNIRKDAIDRSYSVNLGKIAEHLVPFHKEFISNFNPNDARFIGGPVDFIVFNGLAEGKDNIEVWLVEIKTGKATLNNNQKLIMNSVLKKESGVKLIENFFENLKIKPLNIEELNYLGISEQNVMDAVNRITRIINGGLTLNDAIEKFTSKNRFSDIKRTELFKQILRSRFRV